MIHRQDVIIIGGGMVGSALACALGDAGFSVLLVEEKPPLRHWPIGEVDMRVSALSRASQNLLCHLGAWKRMRDLGISAYQRMRIWDSGSHARLNFDCREIAEDDLGHIVENRVTQLALWERLEQIPSVHIRLGSPVESMDLSKPSAKLADGSSVDANLIVGADGRDSRIRNLAQIGTLGWAYDQLALVATVTTSLPHRNTAFQRFMESGPLAFLPLRNDRSSIVWSTSPRQASVLMGLKADDFLSKLELASDNCLGKMLDVGQRAVFPLRLQHAKNYVKPGMALVGDAAHAVHPLAGQGVNLGFMDVAALAQALIHGRHQGRPCGHIRDLRQYERTRKGDNLSMLFLMDGIKRVFSNQNPIMGTLRGIALQAANQSTSINRHLMCRAMGLIGERPSLVTMIRKS